MYKILLVDDDPHILASNETYLKKHGYDTATAADGWLRSASVPPPPSTPSSWMWTCRAWTGFPSAAG